MTGQNNKKINISSIKKTVIQPEPVSIKRTGSTDDRTSAESANSVAKQVAALKKIPEEIIAVNPAEEKITGMEKRLQKALAENQKLSVTIDSVKKENDRLQSVITRLNKEVETEKNLAEANENSRVEVEKKILELQSEISILNTRIADLQNQQVSESDYVLTSDNVNSLLEDIRNNLSGDLPGLLVRDIELRLNVQVKPQGENEVVMIPVTKETTNPETNGEFVIRMMPFRR